MKPSATYLEHLALQIADNQNVDWNEAKKTLAGMEGGEALLRGLSRLEAIQLRFRSVGSKLDSETQSSIENDWRWGHLTVGELVGSGSFGDVYRAFDPVLERPVALKLRTEASVAGSERTFLAEARRLAQVRHPNVLAIHGAGTHNNRVGLWADFLEGKTLEHYLEEEVDSCFEQKLAISLQLAEALVAVHRAGIVHGDIKASNLMIQPEGRAVLMDFGAGSEPSTELRSGPAVGSPLSMAPELFSGQSASSSSDMYASGVILFRILTGRYPIEASSFEDLQALHQGNHIPDWEGIRRPPRSMRTLIEELLSVDPEKRPSAEELLASLLAIEAEPQRRRRRFAVATVIASLVVALGASSLGWLSARRSSEEAFQAKTEAEATSAFLTDLLLAPDVLNQGPQVQVVEIIDHARLQAESDLEKQPLLRGRILWLIGRVKTSLGQHEEALEIFLQSEEAFASVPGEEAWLEGAEVRLRRARLHLQRADLDLAEETLEEMATRVSGLPEGSKIWTYWMRNQAYLLNQRGRLDEAEPIARKVLDALSVQGEESAIQLARLELAIVLEKLGKMEEAEPLYREYLDWVLHENGDRNENTLIVRNNLAGLTSKLGRLEEAETLFRKNIEVARDWLGEEHRLHLLSLSGLIEVVGQQGRLAEAEVMEGIAWPLADIGWGEDHPRTLILHANAAGRRLQEGRMDEAEELLVPAIAKLEEQLGPSAYPPLQARMTLAQLLIDTGRAEEAAEVSAESRILALENHGPDSILTLGHQALLGEAWLILGNLEESLPLLRMNLEKYREVLGDYTAKTLQTQMVLARAEVAAGHETRAQTLACEAVAGFEKTMGKSHSLTLEAERELATLGGC